MSRLPAKWADDAPRVDVYPQTGRSHWRIGESWLHPAAYYSQAGWKEWPPSTPPELEDSDRAGDDPKLRLERMDEYGISAAILYPNIMGFNSLRFMQMPLDLSLACTRAYNDFISDWASVDTIRLIPIGMVPFWDLDEAVLEMRRCAEKGHRGVLFANRYERVGLPPFTDPYWDPIYAAASDFELAINYHIGFADPDTDSRFDADALAARTAEALAAEAADDDSWQIQRAVNGATLLMSQSNNLVKLVTSGVCDRFPTVKFVSVESGFGYVPFLLECLDWFWRGSGLHASSTLLPSEYFARQCYGTFWFEKSTLRLLDTYPDNFMFSTDFPHPISVAPGPASPADVPAVHIAKAFGSLPEKIARKALQDNARNVYRLQ